MEYEKGKQKIIDALTAKINKKTKFYFSDLVKILGEKPRKAKIIINEMVAKQELVYWSSGSTTMYSLPGTGKQAEAEGEN